MKRVVCLLSALFLALACLSAAASDSSPNPALERAREIEQYLEGSYSTKEAPALYNDELAGDYNMICRADESGRSYILAVRKPGAPPLPEGVTEEHETSGGWGEPLNTRAWRLGVSDGGWGVGSEVLYSFSQLSDALIQSFENYNTLFILPDTTKRPAVIPQVEDISEVMTASGRARIEFRRDNGFVANDESRWQISVKVHNRDTYLSGITYAPTSFYMNLPNEMENLPRRIIGAKAAEKSIKAKNLQDAGAWLSLGLDIITLYTDKNNVKGYFERSPEEGKPTWHYDVNAWNQVMEIAQKYAKPKLKKLDVGDLASATLEWPSGDLGHYDGAPIRSQTITDKKSLNQLKKLLSGSKYHPDSACPFSAFLTLTRKNGETLTMAIATDSCNMAYIDGGLSFQYGGPQKRLRALFDKIDYERDMD